MKKLIPVFIIIILILVSLFIFKKINNKPVLPIEPEQKQENNFDYNDLYDEYFGNNQDENKENCEGELPKICNGYLYTVTGNKILLTKIVRIRLVYIDVGGIDFPEAMIWYRDDNERLQLFSIPYNDYVRLGSFPYYRETPKINYIN